MKPLRLILLSILLLGCTTNSNQEAAAEKISFIEICSHPKQYEGRLIETKCLLLDDGFETHWLLYKQNFSKVPPICYSFTKRGAKDKQRQSTLSNALARRGAALVTIRGKLKINPETLGSWRHEFLIDKIIAAEPNPIPSKTAIDSAPL